jgi:transcriptional regulator
MSKPADLLQGTLNMLILQVLSRKKANGYEIAKLIEERSDEALQVDHGSLYPALRRLEANGWIAAEWATSPTNRQARYYSLTAAGRKQIGIERSRWQAAVLAVSRVMGPA